MGAELFDIAINDFVAKKDARCNRMVVLTELVVNVTKCMEQNGQNVKSK